jgi:hypothetical protein
MDDPVDKLTDPLADDLVETKSEKDERLILLLPTKSTLPDNPEDMDTDPPTFPAATSTEPDFEPMPLEPTERTISPDVPNTEFPVDKITEPDETDDESPDRIVTNPLLVAALFDTIEIVPLDDSMLEPLESFKEPPIPMTDAPA